MYHLSHAVKMDKYRSVIISSPDTDVLVCAIYNFSKLLYFGLAEFWFTTGKRNSRKFIPVHEALDVIESETIDILPALHALTSCDSTSRVSTKAAALRTAIDDSELLHSFGWGKLTDKVIANAEK